MTSIFNRYSELDPALEAAQIEAKVGSPVFDKWSYLDESLFNAQAAAALGGTLDLPALLDPARARAEFEAMATGGGGGGDFPPAGALAALDFVNGQYYAGGSTRAVGDLLGTDANVGTVFDPSLISASGLAFRGVTGVGGSLPSLIGPLLSDFLGTAGSTVVFDLDWQSTPDTSVLVSLDVYNDIDQSFVPEVTFALNTDLVFAEYVTDAGPEIVYSGGAVPTLTHGRIKVAFTATPTKFSYSVDGASVQSANVSTPPTWSQLDEAYFGTDGNADYIRSFVVYAPKSDAELPALSTIA